MNEQKETYTGGYFTGERALYGKHGVIVEDSVFDDGESPLKESSDIELSYCLFRWKYPLWYCERVRAENCTWYENARAGMWYTRDIFIKNSSIEAPKEFRRCDGVTLENVVFHNAAETLWNCSGVKFKDVTVTGGTYFGMNCRDMDIERLTLDGNYSFDGAENVVIRNSRLLTKDAFWNGSSVTVRDSFISGEYLGWNSKNLTLINCTIESLQGMCYIDGLRMINCKLINTTLAFEYSNIEVTLTGRADSVFNPASGTLQADVIGELIMEKDKIDPSKTVIKCCDVIKRSERPEWIK